MVDVMRAIAAAASIETPAIVNRTDAQLAPIRPAVRLSILDFLARIFRYLSSAFEERGGKTTSAFNSGFLDGQTRR